MTRLDQIINEAGSVAARPTIKCVDGFTVSVQASWGHYCTDSREQRPGPPPTRVGRRNFSDFVGDDVPPYTSVEVGFPSARPEPWGEWERYAEDSTDPTGTVYGFVPVALVRDLIASHGGEKP